MKIIAATNSISMPVSSGGRYDVIVIGGGVSGSMAAIAAARHGARTLVVEQHGFMGGALTAMGVGPMMSFHNGAGKQLVRGIPQELIDRLGAHDASPGHIPDSITYCSTVTPFESECLKIELETMLGEAGGSILYHSLFAGATVTNDRIGSVTICNKSGLSLFEAAVFVDATGDADLAYNAGVPCVKGRTSDGATQPMTMNLKVGNVDTVAVRAYAESHPEDFHFTFGARKGLERLKRTPRLSLAGYLSEWEAAKASGEITIPRELVLFFETAVPGTVIVNTSRIQGLDPTSPEDVSRAETTGRNQCMELFHFLRRRCPGFEDAVNLGTSVHIGVRESRHIEGLYVVSADDLVNERTFPDPVAIGGYPIDIHSPDKAETRTTHLRPEASYSIPMRAMLAEKPRNLVVVGRAIGATHEASAALRVSPIAMAIGQAGGTLATLSVKRGIDPNVFDYGSVREALLEDDVLLP
ncbi:FAD-dependent oxidoreductase [bacterium]|nr:FAD-dependent oxidoreductase [bacterium]